MKIPWLGPNEPFPPASGATVDPNGLLALSHQLHVDQLIDAYRHGIFPWYSENEPIVWWSPDPRLVLPTAHLHIRRSLQKRLRRVATDPSIQITVDRCFSTVMRACAAPRPGQGGTWITPAILQAYGALHDQGLAHSVEIWVDQELAGGLYGLCIGRMFYGESMFARQTDASKIALVTLVRLMQREDVTLIDCQQETEHLKSLGARTMARHDFCAHVTQATQLEPIDWSQYRSQTLNDLLAG